MDAEAHQEIARGLFRESNDAFILFDPRDDRVVDLNPAAQRMTGFDRQTARALTVWDLFRSDDPNAIRGLAEAYRKTGFFHSREGFWLVRTGGTALPVNVSVSRIHTRPAPLGLAVARDVSERRKAQDELDRFFHLAPALLCIFGPDGRFVRLNRAWEAVLGYPTEFLRQTDPSDLIHPEDVEPTRAMARASASQEVSGFENRWRARDGSERVLSWRAVAADGMVYAVARDMTEAHRLAELERRAEALRLAKETAEAASRAKSEFLAAMSHEIRTPLTAVLGFADVLLDDHRVSGDPGLADAARTIRHNGQHLLELINDLLDLSKVEAGQLRIEPGDCSPRVVAEEVAASMRQRAEAKGLALGIEAAGPIPEAIRTDAGRLRQVLINLVGNAIKFTERGEVRIRIDRDDSGEAPSVRFTVVDTGIGMDAGVLTRAFEPFYRAPGGQGEGTGLGLAISRRIVEVLGGSLAAESVTGLGSTFAVTLPIGTTVGPPAGRAAPAPKEPPRLVGRLLLAEDNEANRRIITLHLERASARVASAANGQQALELVREAESAGDPFDLILMDMNMPVMDGYEATRQIRADGFGRPILALTASAMAEDRDECLRVGCDDFLSKPVDRVHLINVLARHLGRGPA